MPREKVEVLAVDDRPANLLALRSILEDIDIDIDMVEASSGEAALTEATRHDFALILMDVRLPGLDGLATATQLRTIDRTRDVPIMFLTAFDSVEEQVDRAYALGAVDFLMKPIIPKMLMAKVKVFVDLHRKRLAIEAQADRLRESERHEQSQRFAQERATWEAEQLRREVKLQRHIAQEKERSAVILQCIRDAVVAIDAQRRISLLNHTAERLFGLNGTAAQGELVDDVIRLLDPETRQTIAPDRLERELITVGEGGREHTISGSSAPIVDGTGRSRGTVFVYRDVTTQRRMERDLANQQKLDSLGHLAAGLAHDFNNMLGIIMTAASLGKPFRFAMLARTVRALLRRRRSAAVEPS